MKAGYFESTTNKDVMETKMKDIISEQDAKELDKDDETCLLCAAHEEAYKKIADGVVCPYCKHNHEQSITEDYAVVGMSNYYEPEDKIGKFLVSTCDECGGYFALMPEKINYNANHDVYYTGGKDYLNGDEENEIFMAAEEKIQASLNQWVERYEKGEKLDAFYPALWIRRDITHAIAAYLLEKGLKK